MDEYLFLVMAKLKADRLKLEREQRAVTLAATDYAPAASKEERAVRPSWRFVFNDNWRVQS